MLMCPKCGGIAYRNSYFGIVTCQSCGWKVSIKEYEELEVTCVNQRKEMNTMAKAILELEMPESCETCPIKKYLHYGWVDYICGITGGDCPNPPYEKRRDDCPLKPVEKGGDE